MTNTIYKQPAIKSENAWLTSASELTPLEILQAGIVPGGVIYETNLHSGLPISMTGAPAGNGATTVRIGFDSMPADTQRSETTIYPEEQNGVYTVHLQDDQSRRLGELCLVLSHDSGGNPVPRHQQVSLMASLEQSPALPRAVVVDVAHNDPSTLEPGQVAALLLRVLRAKARHRQGV